MRRVIFYDRRDQLVNRLGKCKKRAGLATEIRAADMVDGGPRAYVGGGG